MKRALLVVPIPSKRRVTGICGDLAGNVADGSEKNK
jgi:hypothetical protein